MGQTAENRYFITKSTAFYDMTTREGRLLLSSLTDKEKFFDFLEDIYEDAEPGQVETVGEYDNQFRAEADYREDNGLFVKVLPDSKQVVLIWKELKGEDGTLYGKSYYKNEKIEHALDVIRTITKTDEDPQQRAIEFLKTL